ncbi:MAG: transcription antitermination factor NusB [Desulfotomaculales bacterium]
MSRRKAREFALQALFQIDVGKAEPEKAMSYAAEEKVLKPEEIDFAKQIVLGVIAHKEEIDRIISRVSHEWEVSRMAAVDRNILRAALYEIIYRPEIPAAVSVNEAVELAKVYGGEDSGRFVNGILGQVIRESEGSPGSVPD